ncbi:hypothetical protein EDB80DRAFT_625294, partial [Ilyonectria destructans]
MEGDAPWALSVMWTLTFITLIFAILRLYTRVGIVKTFRVDDCVYNIAFFLLLLYTVFIQLSANYGFGQNMFEIEDVGDAVRAVLLEVIGQTFAIIGMAVAKWSLGLFLLRLVDVNMIWHRMAIWAAMIGLTLTSISVVFIYWLQCAPPAYLWDRRIRGGFCHINSVPAAFTLSIFCIFVDFFFAIFPWMLLWNLSMNKREKFIILGSMSLGVFAGACGIKRTMELPNLTKQNYLKETVSAIVWSAAEIAVTLICIGIPVCRPLYKRICQKLTSNDAGSSTNPPSAAVL